MTHQSSVKAIIPIRIATPRIPEYCGGMLIMDASR